MNGEAYQCWGPCMKNYWTCHVLKLLTNHVSRSRQFGELAKMSKNASKTTPRSAPSSRGKSRTRTRLPPGTVIVRYKELLRTVTKGTSRFLFVPGSSGLPHLDTRGRMYEMYRLRGPVRVQYRAAVGATANGEVLIGVDYDAKDAVLTYEGTAALSPKSMTPVWRDSTLSVPHNRAMKQKWLVTATDISAAPGLSGTPDNFREDAIAFGLNITSTGDNNTGSIWIEYNVEFASPRQPDIPVNRSICAYGTPTQATASLFGHAGFEAPVPRGSSFYVTTSQGTPTLQSGYTQLSTGSTDGVTWKELLRDTDANIWGSLSGVSNSMVSVLSSASLKSLLQAAKSIRFT